MTAPICHEIASQRPLKLGDSAFRLPVMKNNLWKFVVVLLALALATPAMAQRTKGTVTNSTSTTTNSTVTLTSPK